ncbi:aquaporin [Serratia bockelmannii]|uniref:aquaporin n=1 Tax=Serratia bockelmannii TaxID=2703793 RepID=UPI00236257F2|nr:aquaporin [Serratia bockelmannii]
MLDARGRTWLAEALGSGWLVLCGSGTAVLSAGFPVLGVGFLGIALAFGLGAVTAGRAVGYRAVAGLTPVMAVGLWCAGRLSGRHCLTGIVAQLLGGVVAAGLLYLMGNTLPGFDVHMGFASNGYGLLSPGGFSLCGVMLVESVMAAGTVLMVLGSRWHGDDGYLALGACLVVVTMVTLPVDNAVVSPARSTAMALFAGGDWLEQSWVFWAGPLLGAALGGVASRYLVS